MAKEKGTAKNDAKQARALAADREFLQETA